jgi:hypothetical protein
VAHAELWHGRWNGPAFGAMGRDARAEESMLISADLKCYFCGHVSGEVITDSSHPQRIRAFKPTGVDAASMSATPTRCARCGGPVFLDEAETLSLREAAALFNAARSTQAERPARATA